jgi:hypothetical protein
METLTSLDKFLRTELVFRLWQENAAEKLKHNHETQRIAPETLHNNKSCKYQLVLTIDTSFRTLTHALKSQTPLTLTVEKKFRRSVG